MAALYDAEHVELQSVQEADAADGANEPMAQAVHIWAPAAAYVPGELVVE